jgi:hypothetical protein
VKSFVGDIFKSTDFAEILENAELLRRRLYETGCFKSVEVIIDEASSILISI